MVNIATLDKTRIFDAVRAMYTDVARHPERPYHFPTGHAGCVFVGYPEAHLAELPALAVESFAGVAYPFAANVIREGDTVLDIGAGSGTDLLLAARLAGDRGHAIGLDLTAAMLERLSRSLSAASVRNAALIQGNAEHLPLPDASVDVVTSNGVINLVPDKPAAFAELFRVLAPGGRLQIADIALGQPLSGDCLSNPTLWAECIVGATLEDEYLGMLARAGFAQIELIGRLDYFGASISAATRSIAESFLARSVVIRAVKPPAPPLPAPLPWPRPDTGARGLDTAPQRSTISAMPSPAATLDGCGQTCGSLEPQMKQRMRTLESGQILEVRVDDPSARLGVPAWSRLTGHVLVAAIEDDAQRTRFFLRKR
jgi:SAM-dependent methyltransferase/TusA-related sulfurtransferase